MTIAAINKGIYDRMANDATLTDLLSTYKGSPAIFTIPTIPSDATFPFITANEDFSVIPFDTKTVEGRDVSRYIRVFADASGSRSLLDSLSERVRFLFHRKHNEMTIAGYQIILINVEGPEFLATPELIYGVEFTVRFVLQNNLC